MDAANPLRRWLLVAGLAAAPGCHTGDSHTLKADPATPPPAQTQPVPNSARPQMPPDGPPPATLGPPAAVLPASQLVPAGVNQTSLSTPAAVAPPLSAPGSVAPVREIKLDDKPRVKVVAVIGNGNIITDEEVRQAVRQRMEEYVTLSGSEREAREQEVYRFELKHIIDRELIIAEMTEKLRKNKKDAAIDDIKDYAGRQADRQVRDRRRQAGCKTDKEYEEKVLFRFGLTVPVLRRQLEREAISQEYIHSLVKEKQKGAVGLAQVRDYYRDHPGEFSGIDRLKWLGLFVQSSAFPSAEEARKYAENIRQQAAAGADFVGLVRKYDMGFSKNALGAGGWVKREEVTAVDLVPTLFGLKAGEVSGLVETPTGFHLVKVFDREYAGVRPFDEKVQTFARAALIGRMQDREKEKLADDLWRKAAVRIIDVP